jgi:uncharacterized protein YkwD
MLRRRGPFGVAVLVGILLVPAAGSADSRNPLTLATGLQAALVQEVRALRIRHGLPPLRVSAALGAAANAHSAEMARLGYFGHGSADGASYAARISRYYRPRGYRSWSCGENLLWGSPNVGAARVLGMWLSSPAHRVQLLSRRWREVGVAAVHARRAPGVYADAPATIVTADFGTRTR